MLLCNVFTVLSTAAVADNYAVKMSVSTDKEVYSAGETAIVSVYVEGSSRGGYDLTKISAANIAFGWNNAVLGISAADKATALTGAGMDVDVTNSGIKTHSSDIDASEAAYGWNEIMNYGLILNKTATCASINDVAFTVAIEIADDAADGDYYFGISSYYMSNADDSYAFALTSEEMGDGIYGNCYEADLGVDAMYDLSDAVAKITVGKAEEKVVKHADTMAQWNNKEAGLINVGLVGKFSAEDIAIAFDTKGTSTNVTAVGAKVTINGKTEDKTTNFVYDVKGDESEFWFRAVVEGVPYDATEEISVVYYVVCDGETYESDAITTTGAEVYADAIANEMPQFGA
jgi:hypothetical protein